MLESSILNFGFSPTAQYIVVGALLHVFFVVLFLMNIIIIEKKKCFQAKTKNVVVFTDNMLKSLLMKELNKHSRGDIVHLISFRGSKAEQMDHHAIPILEAHQYYAAAIHGAINNLL